MEDLVKVFKALSDETRLKILLIISKRTICQKGISRHLGISESAVSQHIKVLKESGIVTGIKQGYSVIYVINDDCFKEAKFFLKMINDIEDDTFIDKEKLDAIRLNSCANCKSNKNVVKIGGCKDESMCTSIRKQRNGKCAIWTFWFCTRICNM